MLLTSVPQLALSFAHGGVSSRIDTRLELNLGQPALVVGWFDVVLLGRDERSGRDGPLGTGRPGRVGRRAGQHDKSRGNRWFRQGSDGVGVEGSELI